MSKVNINCKLQDFFYSKSKIMEEINLQMEDIEKDIQKKLVSFCNLLPMHVESWRKVLQEAQDPLTALSNFTEQLRATEQANVRYMEDFSCVQQELQTKILFHIEEELVTIKIHTTKLEKVNQDLKNKLANLEKATVDLDWDLESPLIKGSPIQPPLDKLLQLGYEFWIFFSSASKNINNKRKTLNVRDEKSVEEFQKAFSIKLEPEDGCDKVNSLLALTQYVVNDKAIT